MSFRKRLKVQYIIMCLLTLCLTISSSFIIYLCWHCILIDRSLIYLNKHWHISIFNLIRCYKSSFDSPLWNYLKVEFYTKIVFLMNFSKLLQLHFSKKKKELEFHGYREKYCAIFEKILRNCLSFSFFLSSTFQIIFRNHALFLCFVLMWQFRAIFDEYFLEQSSYGQLMTFLNFFLGLSPSLTF